MKFKIDDAAFKRDMKNIVDYSIGFFEGVQLGKNAFLNNLGKSSVEVLKEYIDTNARVNPATLHHVYEWYKVGSPAARLYDIKYTVSNLGLSFIPSMRQSKTIKDGSNVPFYNKAKIMENGTPVIIKPKKASALVFDDNGESVFVKGPVYVNSPGGDATNGAFEKTIDIFFSRYFTQAFMKSSGIHDYLSNPKAYKNNLQSGKRSGRSVGMQVGYKWIANAGVMQ